MLRPSCFIIDKSNLKSTEHGSILRQSDAPDAKAVKKAGNLFMLPYTVLYLSQVLRQHCICS